MGAVRGSQRVGAGSWWSPSGLGRLAAIALGAVAGEFHSVTCHSEMPGLTLQRDRFYGRKMSRHIGDSTTGYAACVEMWFRTPIVTRRSVSVAELPCESAPYQGLEALVYRG